MPLADGVLKTDSAGRVRVPRERREALLAEFARSGMSGAKFAEYIGVKYPTFASWVQERRRQTAGQGGAPARRQWVEAVIESPVAGAETVRVGLAVQLPGGASVEIVDGRQAILAAQLLRALAQPVAASC